MRKRSIMLVFAAGVFVLNAAGAAERTLAIDLTRTQKDLSRSCLGAQAHMFGSWYSMKKMLDQGAAFSTFLSNIGSPVLRMADFSMYDWFSREATTKMRDANVMLGVIKRNKASIPEWEKVQPRDYAEVVKKYNIKSAPSEFTHKKNPPETAWFSMGEFHRFCRANGIRIVGFFSGENYYDDAADEVIHFGNNPEYFDGAVNNGMKRLSWIVKNGYQDLYVGWEIGNECWASWDPVLFAQYARKLANAAQAIQPGIWLAMPIMLRNTDDAHIQRFMAASPDSKKWFNWHDGVIPALGDDIKKISHLQIHVYGAASQYNAHYRGFETMSSVLEKFPQTAHMRYLVTEWRYTGVGGTNHRTFRTGAMWNAKFAMTLLSHPRVDYTTAHEFVCTSGLGYWTPGKGNAGPYEDGSEWVFQKLEDKGKELRSKDGLPHFDVGPFGPVNRMLNTLVTECPVLIEHSSDLGAMSSALFADGSGQQEMDEDKTDLEWFICAAKDRSRIGGVIVNTRSHPTALSLAAGRDRLSIQSAEQMTCDADKQTLAEIPGEEKFWRVNAAAFDGGKLMLPPNSITSFRGIVSR
ncbi:MAG: hypothetical protein AABZ39_16295 [Spirochaetota bacterium]